MNEQQPERTPERIPLRDAIRDPRTMLCVAASALFTLCAVIVLGAWLLGTSRQVLQVPLLLLGVSAILGLLLQVKPGFALTVAILVIATLITGEQFIIKVAHLLRQGGEVGEYLSGAPDTDPVPEASATAIFLEQIRERTGENLPATLSEEAVASALESVQLAQTADKVAASRTLAELYKRPRQWPQVLERFGDSTQLQEDIRNLRSHRVIECPGDEYASCSLTELGRRVAAYLEKKNALFRLPPSP